jgi:hypothetical protein
VEATVCTRLGLAYDLAAWADTMWWETAKSLGIYLPTDTWAADQIRGLLDRPFTRMSADEVMAVTVKRPARTKARPAVG